MTTTELLLEPLVDHLGELVAELSIDYQQIRIVAWKPTRYADFGIAFGISCLLPGHPEVDQLDLEVSVREGKLDADVVWGHPSGHIECSWTEHPQVLSVENVAWLREDLPRLIRGLRLALERGSPPS